jgi:hypothetical protein
MVTSKVTIIGLKPKQVDIMAAFVHGDIQKAKNI